RWGGRDGLNERVAAGLPEACFAAGCGDATVELGVVDAHGAAQHAPGVANAALRPRRLPVGRLCSRGKIPGPLGDEVIVAAHRPSETAHLDAGAPYARAAVDAASYGFVQPYAAMRQ